MYMEVGTEKRCMCLHACVPHIIPFNLVTGEASRLLARESSDYFV